MSLLITRLSWRFLIFQTIPISTQSGTQHKPRQILRTIKIPGLINFLKTAEVQLVSRTESKFIWISKDSWLKILLLPFYITRQIIRSPENNGLFSVKHFLNISLKFIRRAGKIKFGSVKEKCRCFINSNCIPVIHIALNFILNG